MTKQSRHALHIALLSIAVLSAFYFTHRTSVAETKIAATNVMAYRKQCKADPEKVTAIFLKSYNENNSNIQLNVPDPYLTPVSRSRNGIVETTSLDAQYPSLEPPCIFENSEYRPAKQEEIIWLYIHAKPFGSRKVILYRIAEKRSKWTKIEDTAHPEFDHYILQGALRPTSFLIPKAELADEKKYFVECKSIREPPRDDVTPKCSATFNYRDKLNIATGFTADKLPNVDEIISKSTTLIDRFIQE
ncbi:MAG: hypothetical protein ACAH80_11895 [Alphaproteobacteria bacterium]